ncbi:MAG TPA: septum site-determining protein Ssd [Amycolatopsis sp.]|uniref:septum site-determining protein Ssd n=1 Tax=Amycolatopsis sp. TaxID=37632 RepID=UPI002B45B3E3|nr:septum site-determining protein Ssd [Amycolatopsis sp.]HKS45339.1 septum site-determining protein Ssd [Amycolatopsis sp.]
MTHDRPLVVVNDETLVDEILRLAAAVGCTVQRAPDLVAARPHWARAPLVLIDEQTLGGELPARPGILLVTKGPPALETWQRVFEAGVEKVVSLPDGEPVLVSTLADIAEGPGMPGGLVVGVVGGRGGAGASVLAAAIGLVACRQGDALLIDCDPLGGGVDLLLGAEGSEGLRWPGILVGGGRISLPRLAEALPALRHRGGRLPFVSCAREGDGPSGKAIASVVEAGRRAGHTVICDLPRHLGPEAEVVLERADLAVLVVPAEVRACAAARRVAAKMAERTGRIGLVVRGPAPGGLCPEHAAQAVGAPLLTSMAPERQLDRALESGQFEPRPRGPLDKAARLVLAEARAGLQMSQAAVEERV